MIRMEKQGLEFYEKLAEIKRLEQSEEVKVAELADKVSQKIDERLRMLRQMQREGAVLMMHDVDTQKLHEIETDFLLDDLEDEDSWES